MIKFKKLSQDAIIPRQTREGDAGFDLHSLDNCIIRIGGQAIIPTGIATSLPEGYAGFIWPRSGMATKYMINVHAGLIDENYRGEIKVCLINHGDIPVEVRRGDRIAQMVIQPYFRMPEVIVVDELDETVRGSSGFGSSGV